MAIGLVQRNAVGLQWLAVILLLAGVATAELNRVARGDLFLLSTSYDGAASPAEQYDARVSAQTWKAPTILAIFCCGGLCYALHLRSEPGRWPNTWLVVLLLMATALDLFTTLWFFHEDGIDSEVHPGVRLLGYAYGRTAGPILAKTIQAAGVLCIAYRIPRLTRTLLITTSMVYIAAAAYNALG